MSLVTFSFSYYISTANCSGFGSLEIKRMFSGGNSITKGAIAIPTGALSGSSCKSSFPEDDSLSKG